MKQYKVDILSSLNDNERREALSLMSCPTPIMLQYLIDAHNAAIARNDNTALPYRASYETLAKWRRIVVLLTEAMLEFDQH